jgi:hypothetical protein
VRAKADLADYNVEVWRNRVWKLGRAYPLCPGISDINLFRYSQSVVHLDAEISDRAFDLWCERIIPLHPALVEVGFLKFATRAKPGPLFADLTPDKFGKRGGNGTKIIGRFVRQLGLVDPRLITTVFASLRTLSTNI